MSWQKCPVCIGSGVGGPSPWSNNPCQTCAVCDGKMIIHSVTGKPPETLRKFKIEANFIEVKSERQQDLEHRDPEGKHRPPGQAPLDE